MTTNFNDPSNPKRTDRIQLGDGFTVAREFFDEVCVWIKGRLVELPRNGVYTAKKLAGTDYWDSSPLGTNDSRAGALHSRCATTSCRSNSSRERTSIRCGTARNGIEGSASLSPGTPLITLVNS